LDIFRIAFNKQEEGEKKFRRLIKELNEVRDYHKIFRDEVVMRTCFCNKSKLDLPESLDDPQARKREDDETNQYLERRERI
jgi:hypothetical protein